MTDTGLQLWRELLRKPEDDTLRLVWADWLQESGDEDRAELIRVQCELESLGNPVPNTDRVCELAHREHELITAHPEWHRIPCLECWGNGGNEPDAMNTWTCGVCDGTGDLAKRSSWNHDYQKYQPSHDPRPGSWQKGYWVPHCTLAELAVEQNLPCARCNGERHIKSERVKNLGGTGRVSLWLTCPECKGNGTTRRHAPTPRARVLAQSVPVASLGLVWCEPNRGQPERHWFDAGRPNSGVYAGDPDEIPHWLWAEIDLPKSDNGRYKVAPTQAAATDALHAAAARWLVREVWGKQEEKA